MEKPIEITISTDDLKRLGQMVNDAPASFDGGFITAFVGAAIDGQAITLVHAPDTE